MVQKRFRLVIIDKATGESAFCEIVAPTEAFAKNLFSMILADDFTMESISEIKSVVQIDIFPICPN